MNSLLYSNTFILSLVDTKDKSYENNDIQKEYVENPPNNSDNFHDIVIQTIQYDWGDLFNMYDTDYDEIAS